MSVQYVIIRFKALATIRDVLFEARASCVLLCLHVLCEFVICNSDIQMPHIDQLSSVILTCGRTTTDGTVVVCKAGLDEICMLFGNKRKRRLTPHLLDAVEPEQIRQGEWTIAAIPKLCAWLGVDISMEQWSILQNVKPPHAQSWTRQLDQASENKINHGANAQAKKRARNDDAGKAGDAPKQHNQRTQRKLRPRFGAKLQAENAQLHKHLTRLRNACETLRRTIKKQDRKINKLNTDIEEMTNATAILTDKSALQLTHCKKGGRRLDLHGQLAGAIRRNLSMIAAGDLGLVLLEDSLDRYKVVRCEILGGLRLQASSYWFYKCIRNEMCQRLDKFAAGVTHYSNDATGGNLHKGQKCSTCIADSCYYIDGVTDDFETIADLPSQRRCCDVLTVDGGTAAQTLALQVKHLTGIGAPTWRMPPASEKHLETFLNTSDRGSDQARGRNIVPYDIERHITTNNVVYMSVDCFDHASQCDERTALNIFDVKTKASGRTWTYYSCCVKLGHTWRGYHVPIYTSILKDCGPATARRAKYMCPVCDAGRWGAVHGFETKALAVGIPPLNQAIKNEVAKTKKQRKIKSSGPNECAIEALAAYSEKANRWEQDVITATDDSVFECMMKISKRHAGPLEHLRHFMLESYHGDDIAENGAHLARLVDGKAKAIMSEYDNLLADNNKWLESVTANLEVEDKLMVVDMATCHLKALANGYGRRVLDVCTSVPCIVLLLAKADAGDICDERANAATKLLLAAPDADPGVRNFIRFFREELETAKGGKCPWNLYIVVKMYRWKWRCSVGPNESLHSLMKCITGRARNCTKELFNARVLVKFFLGKHENFHGVGRKGYTGNSEQVKLLTCLGRALLETCTSFGTSHEEEQELMRSIARDRFAPAPPLPDLGAPPAVNAAPARSVAFGAKLELVWRAQQKDRIVKWEPLVIDIKSSNFRTTHATYVSLEHFRYRSWVGRARRTPAGLVALDVPLQRAKVQDIFATHAETIKSGKSIIMTSRLDMNQSCYLQGTPDKRGKRLNVKVGQKAAVGQGTAAAKAAVRQGCDQDKLAAAKAAVLEHVGHIDAMLKSQGDDQGHSIGMDDLEKVVLPEESDSEAEVDGDDDADDALLSKADQKHQDALNEAEAKLCKAVLEGMGVSQDAIEKNASDLIAENKFKKVEHVELDAVLNIAGVMGLKAAESKPDVLERTEELQAIWLGHAKNGIEVLRHRHDHLISMEIGKDRELSLVQPSADAPLVLVHWSSTTARLGRIADVDIADQKSVKAIVCVGDKKDDTDFKAATIVVPAVGTTMRRRKPEKGALYKQFGILQRPQLNDSIVDLRRMWDAASGVAFPADRCGLCDSKANAMGDLTTCALCTMTVHSDCVTTLLNNSELPPKHGFANWPLRFCEKTRKS